MRDLGKVEHPVPLPRLDAKDDAQFDAIIVGAGAAGLSLASHLASAGWGRDVLLVDDGSRPLADRAWAWWSKGDGLLDARAVTAVGRLSVAGEGWRRELVVAPYRYRAITGPRLLEATSRLLDSRPGYRHVHGTVRAIKPEGEGARVTIDLPDAGGVRTVEVRATWVFDSVAPGSRSEPTASLPHLDFLGLRVECAADVFDKDAATLMDFRTDQSSGVAFVYVLPTSPRTALVERTIFVHPQSRDCRGAEPDHETHVVEYLRDVVGVRDYRVVGREVGTIPLVAAPPARAAGPVIAIGAKAGMVKAGTGYGFERIQRHSAEIAARLMSGRHPARAARPGRWYRLLDDALLRVIRDDPAGAVDVLTKLFMANSPARVLAFLDEDAGPLQQLRLFVTLPVFRFVRARLPVSMRRVVRPTSAASEDSVS